VVKKLPEPGGGSKPKLAAPRFSHLPVRIAKDVGKDVQPTQRVQAGAVAVRADEAADAEVRWLWHAILVRRCGRAC
jgi:hypothetical protein